MNISVSADVGWKMTGACVSAIIASKTKIRRSGDRYCTKDSWSKAGFGNSMNLFI